MFGNKITVFLTSVTVLLKVEKTVWDWELMNDIKPIWQRPAKEVEEDEYTAFYKTFSKVSSTNWPELSLTAGFQK